MISEYIVKPTPNAFPSLSENEHAIMKLCEAADLKTAQCSIANFVTVIENRLKQKKHRSGQVRYKLLFPWLKYSICKKNTLQSIIELKIIFNAKGMSHG